MKSNLEENLQELEQYVVRQLPTNVEPRLAFKLPQEVDHHTWSNERYLRSVCTQETGRVLLRGADKRTLYDLAQRGEVLARFQKPVSDGPFVIDRGIFVQEVGENGDYLVEKTEVYDVMSGKLVHTLPFGASHSCKTRTSYLYHEPNKGRIRDLVACSELSYNSTAAQREPCYCDITHFLHEHVQLLIENNVRSVFDAVTGHLVFGVPAYMFCADETLFSSNKKVVRLYDWSDDYWVGDYLVKKENDYDHPKRLFTFPKRMKRTAYYFNNDVFLSDSGCSHFSKHDKGYWRLHDGILTFKELLPLRGEPVQVGNEVWDIGDDKSFIYSLTTGRYFLFPHKGGAHEIYDIPNKNPLIVAADKQTFYEVPLEKVISFENVRDVLQGNDARRYDIILEESA